MGLKIRFESLVLKRSGIGSLIEFFLTWVGEFGREERLVPTGRMEKPCSNAYRRGLFLDLSDTEARRRGSRCRVETV